MRPLLKKTMGVVATVVVLIVVFTIIFVGNPFSRQLHLKAHFLDVNGLREGAEVRLAGVPVGKVTRIDILPPSPMPAAPRVDVSLSLPNKIGGVLASERIRTDSTASLEVVGWHTDGTVINIQPGTIVGQPIQDGALLPTSSSNTVNDFAGSPSDLASEFFKQLAETRKKLDEMRTELEKSRPTKKGGSNSPGGPANPAATPGATPDYNQILERLEPGVILFDPPSRMTVGTTEQVMVRLAKSVTSELSSGVTDYSRTKLDTVPKIGPTMKVQLKGEASADFEIYPISHEEQVVSETGVTEWTWNVTPTTSGTHKLKILVTIVLGDKQKDYPAYQKEVLVSVNPLYSATHFFGSNWPTLIGLIISSGLIGTIVAWRKRRKSNQPPPPWQAA